jgi:hypothetical protein
MSEPQWRTLPLFEREIRSLGAAPQMGRHKDERTPLDQVLHVYWSASVEAHALGALARNATYPDERRALLELQRIEEERKDLAARFLETVWGVQLPGSRDAAGHGDELGSLHAA